jgi:F-type H+-transporting ATPase subunit delta
MAVRLTTVRYVKALFSLADKRGERQRALEDLLAFRGFLEAAPEVGAALRNPRLSAAAKRRILEAAGVDTASPSVQDFARLCLDRGRAEVLIEAPEEFARLDREARGIVRAALESAKPLTDDLRLAVRARLEEITGKSIELSEEVLPDLIGGIRVRIGSRMYDGSVRRQLEDLGIRLRSARMG